MTTCKFETPAERAGDPAIPCKDRAIGDTSYCEIHTWSIRKQRVEQRLMLARRSNSDNEGMSAALAGVTLMAEHRLVFHPRTAMIDRAVTVYASAASDDDKRKAALNIAKASVGSKVLRDVERNALVEAESRSAQRRAAATAATEAAARRAQSVDLRRNAAATITAAMDWMKAASGFARDIMDGVETRDGQPIARRAEHIQHELRVIDKKLGDFREALSGEPPPKKRARAKPKATKAAKAGKATRQKARAR